MPQSSIYQALCFILSDRFDAVDWGAFSKQEWDAYIKRAQAEGVAPMVHKKLKEHGLLPGLPGSIRDVLAQAYYRSLAFNQVLLIELERVLTLLELVQVKVIVLKGAALAVTVYPEIGLRPMRDLDLLVKRSDIRKASELVKSLDYFAESTERIPGIGNLSNHHISFRNQGNKNLLFELHWGLIAGDADWRSPSVGWFFEQVETSSSKAIPFSITTLNPSAHLIYLSAHLLLQHGEAQARLCWLYDIHLLICQRGSEINWGKLFEDAARFHWGPAVGAALEKVHLLFGTPLPDDIDIQASKYQDQRTLDLLHRKSVQSKSRFLREYRKIQTLDWRARILVVLSIIFPSPAHIKRHYYPNPQWLWPFYYLYRWMDITIDFVFTTIIWNIKIIKSARKNETNAK